MRSLSLVASVILVVLFIVIYYNRQNKEGFTQQELDDRVETIKRVIRRNSGKLPKFDKFKSLVQNGDAVEWTYLYRELGLDRRLSDSEIKRAVYKIGGINVN